MTPARRRSPRTGTSSRRRPICMRWSGAFSARRPHRRCRLRQRPRGRVPRRQWIRRRRLRRLRRAAGAGAAALSAAHFDRRAAGAGRLPDAAFDNVLCETVIMHLRAAADLRRGAPPARHPQAGRNPLSELAGHRRRRSARSAGPALLGLRERADPRGASTARRDPARRRAGQRVVGQENPPHRGAQERPTSLSGASPTTLGIARPDLRDRGSSSWKSVFRAVPPSSPAAARASASRSRRALPQSGADVAIVARGKESLDEAVAAIKKTRQGPRHRRAGRRRRRRRYPACLRRGDEGVRQGRHHRQQRRHLARDAVREGDRRNPASTTSSRSCSPRSASSAWSRRR